MKNPRVKKRYAATAAGVAILAGVPAVAVGVSATNDAKRQSTGGGGAILAAVNLERQMAGLDALATDAGLESGCQEHASYMSRNRTLTHAQDPAKPGASETGQAAGQTAVLARNSAGYLGNPWKFAPFHEFQVLHPWLTRTGVAVSGDYACMVTLGDRSAPGGDAVRLVTVPGTGQYIRPAEVARELPFVPGDEVGLPQGTKTGPHIYVYALGPERFSKVQIQSATLTAGDDGSEAPVKWVDASSPRSARYLEGGAILIPVSPLKEGVSYGLRVEAATTTAAGSRLLISRTTSFITGPDESQLAETPELNDTVTAASTRGGAAAGSGAAKGKTLPLTLDAGGSKLAIKLSWSHAGLRARLSCASTTQRCEGPLRVLVRKPGRKVQRLRFKARRGPLKVSLAPGRAVTRTVKLNRKQRHHGKKRGFAVRWGAASPVRTNAVRR